MTKMTRRSLLSAGAAGLAATSLGFGPARAQNGAAERGPSTADGVYAFNLGAMTGYMLHDGIARRPLEDGFVRNAELAEVEAALAARGMPREHLDITFTVTMVESGSDLVLIDTGTGGRMAETASGISGPLEAAGFSPEQVTRVVLSHFHPDHINGLRDESGALVFPNAEVSCPRAEWLYWMDGEAAAAAPEAARPNFQLVGEVLGPLAREIRLLEDGEEVVPGIHAEAAHGHTPGHMIFRLSSGNEQSLVISDTTNHPALFARRPDWQVQFDMDPEQAEATRRRVLEEVVVDQIPICGYHYPFPARGMLERDGNEGYRFLRFT